VSILLSMPEVTIADAAHRLGVSDDTIRRRVKAGDLAARRDEHGRLWIPVDDDQAAATPAESSATAPRPPDRDRDLLLSTITAERDRLAEHVRFLAEQLDRATRAQGELRELLAREQRRTLALPAPAEHVPQDAPHTAEHRPPWWRRLWRGTE
jgi:excisionase family DNA binding protein